MLFNSYIFIFLFLPLALIGWYGLNHMKCYRTALAFLCGMSFWFYAYFNVKYLLLLIVSIAMNYGVSFLIRKAEEKSAAAAVPLPSGLRRFFLVLGVGTNLALFFYFKYFDFFITNVNAVFGTGFALRNILLPLGISFFTFQQLSFIIDRARGEAPHYPLLNYVTFVTFFPQLIAGPIVLYDEMMPQFMDPGKRRLDREMFRQGVYIFVLGLAKKVLLADALSGIVDYGYAKAYYLEFWTTALVAVSYVFQLYFDFSGYCDMAIGIGKMFGIELPLNFDSPYLSCNFKEIWQRWHKTLGRFFTKYVYIPLGGSRKGKVRTCINVFIVFALSGLWHGAAWTYVLWGALNGLLIIWDNLGIIVPAAAKMNRGEAETGKRIGHGRPCKTRPAGQEEKKETARKMRYLLKGAPFITLPRPVMTAFTFVIWVLLLIFFRADTMEIALQMYRNLAHFWLPGYLLITAEQFAPTEMYIVRKALELLAPDLVRPYSLVLWLLFLAVCSYIIFFRKNSFTMMKESKYSRRTEVLLALLFAWSVISLSGVSTFLYFNF